MDENEDAARNRQIFERRRTGQTLASLATDYGLSRARIRQIAIQEQRLSERRGELERADRLPQQPNALHLSPHLRRTLQHHFHRDDVTPLDVLENGFRERDMYRISNFRRRYWRELVEWMGRAGFSPDP